MITRRASSPAHAVAAARCVYPAIIGRTVAVWPHPDTDPVSASLMIA